MSAQPILATERLVLRPFTLSDAPEQARLAGAREVAAMTLRIPHPYALSDAETWLATHAGAWERGESAYFAVTLKDNGTLVGTVGLEVNAEHARAELGFWAGVPYWGRGYTTEAARAVVGFAFRTLGLNRVYAYSSTRNPASARVQEKIGLRREGLLRGHIRKWGEFHDDVVMGVLREEWEALKEPA